MGFAGRQVSPIESETTSPHLFPLLLGGAQALMLLCKIWIHVEASCKTAQILILQEE